MLLVKYPEVFEQPALILDSGNRPVSQCLHAGRSARALPGPDFQARCLSSMYAVILHTFTSHTLPLRESMVICKHALCMAAQAAVDCGELLVLRNNAFVHDHLCRRRGVLCSDLSEAMGRGRLPLLAAGVAETCAAGASGLDCLTIMLGPSTTQACSQGLMARK